jgi:hypothetical protein
MPVFAQSPWSASGGTIYCNPCTVGIGTSSPFNPFTVSGGSHPNTDANAGVAGFSLSSQTGAQTDENLLMGVHTGDYSWIQPVKPGCCNRNLALNPNGGNVGIGTTNPQYKLAVTGNIGAQDIIVTNYGWSDYVFRPGYRLRPLSEVSAFIQKHHHLPDIPTEAEVKEKGVSMAAMQTKLLAKIEELTLHMIQADKRNNRLERQNQELRERIARLENAASSGSTPAAPK